MSSPWVKAGPTLHELKQPLSVQYAAVLREQAERDPSDSLYPVTKSGFFRLVGRDGKDLGLAFYCPRCKASACGLDEATAAVRHCGKVTKFPTGLFGFLTRLGLQSYLLERTWF